MRLRQITTLPDREAMRSMTSSDETLFTKLQVSPTFSARSSAGFLWMGHFQGWQHYRCHLHDILLINLAVHSSVRTTPFTGFSSTLVLMTKEVA